MSAKLNKELDLDLDLDSWLNGGQRKAHYVTLYARADLIADIEELERRRVVDAAVREEDASLGGERSPNAELDEQIAALYEQLDASKREFRVSSRTADELAEIREQVQVDLKEAADDAAAKARTAAQELTRRMGIKTVADVNNVVRAKALEASNKVFDNEVSMRAVADATTIKIGEEWVPLTVEQLRRIYKAVGEAQADLLSRAFSRATNEAPVVTFPKS